MAKFESIGASNGVMSKPPLTFNLNLTFNISRLRVLKI